MAILHQAELRPSKLELLADWLPTQAWAHVDRPAVSGLERVASYRFDDPAGEVGVEIMIVRVGDGSLLQVPLTYRGVPRVGAEQWLICTMDHSVLGERWVYDASGDPVYASALAEAILAGGTEVEQFVQIGDRLEPHPNATQVRGSGTPDTPVAPIESVDVAQYDDVTVISAGSLRLSVRRVLGDDSEATDGDVADAAETLVGTWEGQTTPVVLAFASF